MSNPELAYLLGLITGKGNIIRGNTHTDIIIEIPHKNLKIQGMDTELSVRASLNDIRNIIEPLTGVRLATSQIGRKTIIKLTKENSDFFIREVNKYFGHYTSCKDFRIPQLIFNSSTDIKREFMVGLADVAAHVRKSNCAYGLPYHHRVYIEVATDNWHLCVDIGNLLYELNVPIQDLNWAHPNMRDPQCGKYNSGKRNFWLKEHQIKIYADEFQRIGFRIIHKMRALEELASINRDEWDKEARRKANNARSQTQREKIQRRIGHIELTHHKFYWETRGRGQNTKSAHPMENNDRIPAAIRGNHYNSWKEIAKELGYPANQYE